MKAYVHKDNSISIPFCEVGKKVAYAFHYQLRYYSMAARDCCTSMCCTCSNDESIERIATEQERDNLLKSLTMAARYEIEYNL